MTADWEMLYLVAFWVWNFKVSRDVTKKMSGKRLNLLKTKSNLETWSNGTLFVLPSDNNYDRLNSNQ
jgi:hypothetical protein